MKIIENKSKKPTVQKANIQACHWCESILEIDAGDIKFGNVYYSQREVDHNVKGFVCPCCNQFAPLK